MEIDFASELFSHFGVSMKIGARIYTEIQKTKNGDVTLSDLADLID